MNVSQLMSKELHTCRTTDTLERAAQLMWEHDIGCLPVIDDLESVAGLITDRDVCMAAYTRGIALRDAPVTVAMSNRIVSCSPSTELGAAEAQMQRHQIRRLLVLDEASRILGLISLNDIARASSQGRVPAADVVSTLATVTAPRVIAMA